MTILHELAKPIVFIVIIRFINKVLPSLQMVKLNALLLNRFKDSRNRILDLCGAKTFEGSIEFLSRV